jgi:hypothetical protein
MRYATGFVLAATFVFATGGTRVDLQAGGSRSSKPAIPSVASQNQRLPPDAPASAYGIDVPLAYYNLSFTLSKRTGGITPPVQARVFAYMGLALYESVVGGMPHSRSIAASLHGVGPLPKNDGTKYWPLVASAALAEVMRGLWGDATNVAAQNVADIDALEQQIADGFDLQGSLARRSIDYGHAVGAAIYGTSLDDGEDRSYLTNFPTDYVAPVCDGCWVPTAAGQIALQPYWKDRMTPFVLTPGDCGEDGPPAFSTDPASEAYQQAYEVYVTRNNLTPEQAIIARFWADGPGSINGPGHSLSTAGQILQLVGANLAEAAETYARVGLAVGDGVIRRMVVQVHVQLAAPGHLHQALYRSELDYLPADAAVPRVHVGALGPDQRRDQHADRAVGRCRLHGPHARQRRLRAAHVRAPDRLDERDGRIAHLCRHPLPLGDLRRPRPGPLRGRRGQRAALAQVTLAQRETVCSSSAP